MPLETRLKYRQLVQSEDDVLYNPQNIAIELVPICNKIKPSFLYQD